MHIIMHKSPLKDVPFLIIKEMNTHFTKIHHQQLPLQTVLLMKMPKETVEFQLHHFHPNKVHSLMLSNVPKPIFVLLNMMNMAHWNQINFRTKKLNLTSFAKIDQLSFLSFSFFWKGNSKSVSICWCQSFRYRNYNFIQFFSKFSNTKQKLLL